VLKAVLKNLNHHRLPFELPTENAPRFRKPLVPTAFVAASYCGLQDLFGCAYQMPWRLDAQVGIICQGQGLLPRLLRKLPIRESLQMPSHATKKELLVIRTRWLPKQGEIFSAQLPYRSPAELFNFDPLRMPPPLFVSPTLSTPLVS
jgi:hypothetical protein